MQIVSALFIDEIELRQVPGPSTRIDLSGVQFSAPAPGPFPVTITPHMVVLVRNGEGENPDGALEVVFFRDGEQIARNVQAVEIEQNKFGYRLVRAEMEFTEYGTVEAHCRMDMGPVTIVPYTLLPPPEA